jgi:hypothetical protein
MLQARLVATQVMDLWHISGAILTDEPDGQWSPLATFSDDIPLADCAGDEDPSYSLLRALRLWSEMTISR